MVVYRISSEKYIEDLSGTGAKIYGGRWNDKGVAVLYTAEHKSLAALEILIHVDRATAPDDLKLIALEISDEAIEELDEKEVVRIENAENSNELQKIYGKNWLENSKKLALKVPSVLIKGEQNILLNPELIEIDKNVKIKYIEDFTFDDRFFL